jgi:Protein of unknown function (DUF2905)
MGRLLILVGLLLVVVGLLVTGFERWFGAGARGLPGDIVIRRGNFTFYFPIVTSILVSLALTALFWLIGWFSRR